MIIDRFHRIAATAQAATILFLVTFAGAATGQDTTLPTEGGLALTVSLIDSTRGRPVAIGQSQMAQVVNQIAHLFSGNGSGFLPYAIGNCASLQIVDVAAGTIEISGYCSYRDSDGDEIFEQFSSDGPVALDAIVWEGDWTGGTGKYAEITGETRTELAAPIQNGDAILVGGRKTGNFAFPAAEAAFEEPAAVAQIGDDPALLAALVREGERLFGRNCEVCHGGDGEGSEGPRFADNERLAFVSSTIRQILFGGAYMPEFGGFTDREVSAVATYIRNSFGNSFGILPEASVAPIRGD
jgi:mono/diheme cytochrome c family protein